MTVLKVLGLLSVTAAFCLASDAQDLGSSNKLFGAAKPAASAKSVSPKKKAPAAKPKAATSRTARNSSVKPKVTAKKTPASKADATAKASTSKSVPATAATNKTASAKAPAETAKSQVGKNSSPVKAEPASAKKQQPKVAKADPAKNATVKADAASGKKIPSKTEAASNTVDSRFKAFGSTKKPETKAEIKTASKAITLADRQQFERRLQEGDEARRRGNYSAAEVAYRNANSIIANDPRALNGLGAVYAARERWDDAESAYRSAVEADPKNAASQLGLSYVLSRPLAVDDLFDRYDRSEKAARIATQLSPRDASAFLQLGEALEVKGLIGPETENAYRRAKELDPSSASAYAHLARVLRRRGRTQEADAEYQKAIERAKDARTQVLVAEVMQSELRFDDSETLLRNALAEEPRNYKALLMLGRVLGTQRKFDEAEQTLRRAAEVSPDPYASNSLLASIYLQQGKVTAAESALFNAQRTVPASEKRQLARQFETVGDAYGRLGKRADAARSYRIAASLNRESPTLAAKLTAVVGR